jgi:hypothetical protein
VSSAIALFDENETKKIKRDKVYKGNETITCLETFTRVCTKNSTTNNITKMWSSCVNSGRESLSSRSVHTPCFLAGKYN